MPELAMIAISDRILALSQGVPESLGYLIIAIGIVGLALSLVVLVVVSRRQHNR
jgi:hypothetical protein